MKLFSRDYFSEEKDRNEATGRIKKDVKNVGMTVQGGETILEKLHKYSKKSTNEKDNPNIGVAWKCNIMI